MKPWILLGGATLALLVGSLAYGNGLTWQASWTAAVVALCAAWWVTEPIPIPVTSLIPIAVFPLVGVLTPSQVGACYGHPLVLLFLGGFILSTAMVRSGAHRRIALGMVSLFGASHGRWIVCGFMAASALLSMWISNIATTLMLLPIVMAVLEQSTNHRFAIAMLLGVAYASSIGGISTPVGTAPNLIFLQVYEQTTGLAPTFLEWMTWAMPVTLTMGPIAMLWLTRNLGAMPSLKIPAGGAWRTEEVRTLAVFAVTALLWTTRKDPFGGWSALLGLPQANDASVGLLAVIAMFLIPNGQEKGQKLLDWDSAKSIPWGLLILFGGGITIAKAFATSGLSTAVGDSLGTAAELPPVLLIASVCLIVTFLTEITSNTATATLLMPILAAVAVEGQIDPRLIMVPATLSASFAFMLPVATPPNAVVFGAGRLTTRDMAREGLVLNLLGAAVVTTLSLWSFG